MSKTTPPAPGDQPETGNSAYDQIMAQVDAEEAANAKPKPENTADAEAEAKAARKAAGVAKARATRAAKQAAAQKAIKAELAAIKATRKANAKPKPENAAQQPVPDGKGVVPNVVIPLDPAAQKAARAALIAEQASAPTTADAAEAFAASLHAPTEAPQDPPTAELQTGAMKLPSVELAGEPVELDLPDDAPLAVHEAVSRANTAYFEYVEAVASAPRSANGDLKVGKLQSRWRDRYLAVQKAVDKHNAALRSIARRGVGDVADEEELSHYVSLHLREHHGDPESLPTWRYDLAEGEWFRWTGTVWRMDPEGLGLRDVVREAVGDITTGKQWRKQATYSAVIQRLRSTPGFKTPDGWDWDADPRQLCTPGGVIDLRTGELRPARLTDYATQICTVAPQPGTPARWLQFLDEATGSDAEAVAYLQRLCGYFLSGETSEQVLPFLYGDGGNGKGVFIHTIAGIAGGYAVAAFDTLIEQRDSQAHPTEVAALRHARLAYIEETRERMRWNETRVKLVTGGKNISTRFMGGDFFEMSIKFKLLVCGNHAPRLTSVGNSWRRRLHMLPFTHTPPAVDMRLEDKLREEWPCILAWMVEGAVQWYRVGLGSYAAQVAESEEYFEDQDTLQGFLDEHCTEPAPKEGKEGTAIPFTTTEALLAYYNAYRRNLGKFDVDSNTMADGLKKKGYERHRTSKQRGFVIQLRPCAATTLQLVGSK